MQNSYSTCQKLLTSVFLILSHSLTHTHIYTHFPFHQLSCVYSEACNRPQRHWWLRAPSWGWLPKNKMPSVFLKCIFLNISHFNLAPLWFWELVQLQRSKTFLKILKMTQHCCGWDKIKQLDTNFDKVLLVQTNTELSRKILKRTLLV